MNIYDRDIRKAVFKSFQSIAEYQSNTIVIDEFDVCGGAARADIAVINGKMHGYEIKSGQDTLDRLPNQMTCYNQTFDEMFIVTHENHLSRVLEIIPEWWGVSCARLSSDEVTLEVIREPRDNPSISAQSVAMLLWKDEMITLLSDHLIQRRGLASKSRKQLSAVIAREIDKQEVVQYVRHALKLRKDWRAAEVPSLCGAM